MKKVTVTKEGFLIDSKEMMALAGEVASNIRMNYRMLKRIGVVSYKDHQKLEHFLDTILYPKKEN